MAQTLLAIGLAGVAAVTAQQPVITAAGYTQIACPPPASGDCLQFSVFGNGFGAAQGQLQKGNFITPVPPPPPMPWDTPADLWPSNLATRTGGNGQCVARSLYTGDGFHYRFCPFQQVQHFSSGGFNIGTLGQYSGVIRDSNNANCPGGNAIVGQKFIDGSLCNGVPSTSFVNFVCVDVLGAGLIQWGTNTPMVNAAIRSPDGCSANLTLPLPGACDGARWTLCGSPAASPNPSPVPSPVFSFTQATITEWSDGRITAYAPGTTPPPRCACRRALAWWGRGLSPSRAPSPPAPAPSLFPFPQTSLFLASFPTRAFADSALRSLSCWQG